MPVLRGHVAPHDAHKALSVLDFLIVACILQGLFSTQMKVPDVYGVFKFVISYHRLGYTSIEESWQVSVRPFKHNEYERFLVPAYPYYASAFSMMAGFCLLCFFFLYHK